MFFQASGFFALLFVVSVTSTLLTLRFVKRHEVPRLTMQLGLLPTGLVSLAIVVFFEFELEWVFMLSGVAGTAAGLVGLGALLWATRLNGLQPRVTPIDLSPKPSRSDF